MLLASAMVYGQSDLMITGLIDADLPGGLPKAIEIYVMNDVADLSIYGVGAANNGGGTDGEEFTFPAEAAVAGSYLYIASETDMFVAYFGFNPTYVNSDAAGINGDDAVELFMNAEVVDLYGDIDVDGTDQDWEYKDSWSYRNDGSMPSATFDVADWNVLGLAGIDGETENATSANPWPLGTFDPNPTSLLISGVIDADLPGGLPKAIEIYVINDIADLSMYGLGAANNGGGTDGEEFTFPAEAAVAGSYLYIASETDNFTAYFGFAPTYVSSNAAGINGDDAVELFQEGVVVDLYGDIDVDGNGTEWEYMDSWAYRNNGAGPSETFDLAEWNILGVSGIDGEVDNGTSANPWPIGTYSVEGDETVVATIMEIQFTEDESGDSPLVGESVITSGIVTAVAGNGFWIQDGTGAWNGLFVRQDDSGMLQGDDVTVEAVVQENYGLTRLTDIVDITVNSNDNALPASSAVSTADAGMEDYESVLISVSNTTCTDDDLGFGEWQVDDGSGAVIVDDAMYDAGPVAFLGYDVTGVTTYSFSNVKILPRDAADVVLNPAGDAFGLSFTTSSDNVSETDGTVMYEVEISSAQVGETTVEVAVTGGTAVNGEHFNFTSPTTLTFADGDATAQSFSIEIVDDALANEDRTIELELQNATNGAVFGTSMLTLTIIDDDAVVVITDIAVAAEIDVDGVAINVGTEYTVEATVYGVNMNSAGLSFTLIDATGGMGVYSDDPLDDYVVTEGDIIQMTGTMSQYNGLTQMNPASIVLVSQGNPINEAVTVTELNEFSESNLVRLECVYLLEPGQWDNEGSGFTVDISNGTDEFALRIDNDVDLYSMAPPEGAFNLIGIGGQFDSESPYFDGYQILPRSSADIDAGDCVVDLPPANDNCGSATDLSDLMGGPAGEAQISTIYTNVNATMSETTPENVYSCFAEPDGPSLDNEVWFSFIGDGSTYLVESTNCDGTTNYIPDGDTQMFVLSGICAIAAIEGCNEDGPNAVAGDWAAGLEIATILGQSYLVAFDGYLAAEGEFCVSFTMMPPANNLCDDAADLNDLVGGDIDAPQTSGIYSNVGATAEGDPNPNDAEADCWFGDPLVSQTTWYTFTGDGGLYFIETMDCGVGDYIDDGDTQMAIFTGECEDLTQVACNEDGPQATATEYPAGIEYQTEAGVVYQVMIDGYANADGEFCMQMTNLLIDGVEETSAFEFNAYPNPVKDNLIVESAEVIEAAALVSVLGKTVKEWSFVATQRAEFDMNDVAAGVYLLQVRSGNSFATTKLIVE